MAACAWERRGLFSFAFFALGALQPTFTVFLRRAPPATMAEKPVAIRSNRISLQLQIKVRHVGTCEVSNETRTDGLDKRTYISNRREAKYNTSMVFRRSCEAELKFC